MMERSSMPARVQADGWVLAAKAKGTGFTGQNLEGENNAYDQVQKESQIIEINANNAPQDLPDPQALIDPPNPQAPIIPPDPQNDQPPAQPPVPPPVAPRRSTRLRQPTQYVRDLLQGKGLISKTDKEPTLPRGIQLNLNDPEGTDEEERDDKALRDLAQNVAMAARMADLDGVEPRTVEEAKNCPDWNKWESAINEELERLDKARTWTYVEKP
ncbi:hypothetical protein SERLA73DRAFT_157472 [Serpula lacrymans var. lacrymans S7.3]|uniref:Uncharacterized protein n=1 Tax=Serpula lacrymans var. lacrymans (strain S7.3) TaxID=936435 RepID=F8QJ73_SERL3|nr:hypothetical protein SERLA73DRAFT_157472 [Serpula lacrymans var. lacrymans S7.3]